jgi:hydroxymethylpyrimidine/phosphomethylpyrimidine kinase
MKRILTIAGSDSGGGAGIQADLKAITLLGGYGMSVITALTAQNTMGVQAVLELPLEFIEKQIDSVVSDIGVDAVKTGMLSSSPIVSLVAGKIKQYRLKRVVVDPVMIAKSGNSLLSDEARTTLIRDLIPLATVVTPNLPEAKVLCGFEVNDFETMKQAARQIQEMGARTVLVKGGHLEGEIVDILFDGKRFREYPTPRIPTKDTHGTGCTFASALTTELAGGLHIHESVLRAKAFMTAAIRHSLPLGRGHGPTNPYALISREADRYRVVGSLKKALHTLEGKGIGDLIPEVRSNLGYGLPYAETVDDVAAFPGRITRVGESIATVAEAVFGGSRHVAKIILTVMRRDPEFRSAMNIRFSEEIILVCEKAGLEVRHFDRSEEPEDVKEREGSTLEWGTERVLKEGGIPDIIFDRGDMGKEPMVRVIGRDPDEIVQKILKIKGKLRH